MFSIFFFTVFKIRVSQPLARRLAPLGVSGNAVTALGIGISVAAGVAFMFHHFIVGGLLFIASECCDEMDGDFARERGESGPQGYVVDNIADRLCELGGLAGIFMAFENPYVKLLVMLATVVTHLASTLRLHIERLGLDGDHGLLRKRRLTMFVGLSAIVHAVLAEEHVLPASMLVVLVFACITAGQRIHVLRAHFRAS